MLTGDPSRTDAFRALASPARQRLLRLVRDEERSVGELAELTGATQPAVSQHLAVLRDAGLVAVRTDGRRRLHRVDADRLTAVRNFFDEYWSSSLDDLAAAAVRRAAAREAAS